jgi:hypothetical protein
METLIAVVGAYVALIALVVSQYMQIKRIETERSEWWDAYASLLAENTRKHEVLTAARDAHEELQRAFMQVVRSERVA